MRLAELRARAKDAGLKISLVFPFLAPAGFQKAVRLLEKTDCRGDELIIQDWGLLNWYLERRPPLSPVLGRLLVRQKTGPRILKLQEKFPVLGAAAGELPGFTPAYFKWLQTRGIERAELENPFQGFAVPPRPAGFTFSLHYPGVLVSVTRRCPFNIALNRKERLGTGGCQKICRRIYGELENPELGVTLLNRGNALFYRNPSLPDEDTLARKGVDRIVYEDLRAFG